MSGSHKTAKRKEDEMSEIIKAILFGIVEGITEWLPVSSTGHMIILDELIKLNVSKEFLEVFLVVIQLGAILATGISCFRSPLKRAKTRFAKTYFLCGSK